MADPARTACLILAVACPVVVAAFVPGADALGYDQFAVPKETVVAVAPVAAAAVAALSGGPLRVTPVAGCLAGFLLISAVGLAAATSAFLAWRSLLLSAGGALAFVTAQRLVELGHRRALLCAVGAAAVVGAASILLEAHGLLAGLSMSGRGPGGTEGNRNYMAHALVAVSPLLLVGAARARGRARVVLIGALVVVVMAVVLSRSRGAYLAGTAALVVATAGLLVRGHRRRVAIPLLACAVAVLAAVAMPNRLSWRAARPYAATLAALTDYRAGTGRGRLIQYRNTLAMIADAPLLGVGPGNWSVAYPAHASRHDPSHQPMAIQPVNRLPSGDWIGLAAERGIAGLLCVLAAGLLIARSCCSALRRAGAPHGELAVVCLAALAATAVAGSFDAVLSRPTPLLLAATLIGASAPPMRAMASVRRPRLVAALLVAALLAAVAHLSALVEATLHHRSYRAGGDVAALERAAAATPGDFRLQAQLALHWSRKGRCERATGPARRALASYPSLAAARQALRGCRTRPDPLRATPCRGRPECPPRVAKPRVTAR
jgi:O-antigen ligase